MVHYLPLTNPWLLFEIGGEDAAGRADFVEIFNKVNALVCLWNHSFGSKAR